MTADFAITWRDRFPAKTQLEQVVAGGVEGIVAEELAALGVEIEQPETKSNRRKYSCGQCGINAWGKPGLKLICGDCHELLRDIGA